MNFSLDRFYDFANLATLIREFHSLCMIALDAAQSLMPSDTA